MLKIGRIIVMSYQSIFFHDSTYGKGRPSFENKVTDFDQSENTVSQIHYNLFAAYINHVECKKKNEKQDKNIQFTVNFPKSVSQ